MDKVIAVYDKWKRVKCRAHIKEERNKLTIEVDRNPEVWLPQILAAITNCDGSDYRGVLDMLNDGKIHEWGTWYDEKGRDFDGALKEDKHEGG